MKDRSVIRTWQTVAVIGAAVLIAALLPYKTTVVPAWRLRVVDENGHPYAGKQVRQTWKHYSLELDAGDNLEDRWTDENGYVAFPERTIRASFLGRVILTTFNTGMTLAHGSIGIHADVAATGPQGYKRLEYDP